MITCKNTDLSGRTLWDKDIVLRRYSIQEISESLGWSTNIEKAIKDAKMKKIVFTRLL